MLETVLRLLMHRAILYEGGLLFSSKNYSNEKRGFFMNQARMQTHTHTVA